MAGMTDEQIIEVRVHIGDKTPPTNAQLDDMYDRLGTTKGVILEVLTKRLADLLSKPASFAVSGEYQESNSENIKALQEKIAEISNAGTTPGAANLVTIYDPTPLACR